MSGNNGVPPASVQETGRQFDLGSATTFAIDQAVADGEVDGRNNRAPFRMLSRIAFRGVRMPGSVIHDFRDALTVDERYVDRVRDRYGYEPVLSEGSEARATPSAIVNGRGIYSEEEHQVVMDLMETYTRVIYDSLNPQDHIVHLREVSGALNGAGISPTYDEFG
ncbi:MAG TPA: hypothetical protein VFK11_03920, partial [Candidatus Saccharimonadales bacterium]|nr:hypothetical protein [Candidatus Saccharimonadales bacterium]